MTKLLVFLLFSSNTRKKIYVALGVYKRQLQKDPKIDYYAIEKSFERIRSYFL